MAIDPQAVEQRISEILAQKLAQANYDHARAQALYEALAQQQEMTTEQTEEGMEP